ncbi:uncharacterized protein LOC134283276 [Saccostrea cucullata]|uniref:uncharacterized protein LOC134283276 n=1 Tax=Saccostrea cuccullata TaxID=36930 RepID=UPI002ED50710
MAEKGCIAVLVVIGALVIMTIALIATSLKKLASDEKRPRILLAYKSLEFSKRSSPKNHLSRPIVLISHQGTRFNNYPCLNKDGVQIKLDVTYQYKVRSANLRTVILNFRNFTGYKTVLTYAGEAALHESCSYFNTSQFQSQRAEFQEFVRTKIIERYDILYADITDLQVSNIERLLRYRTLIVALNERPRLLTEAETEKREAETQAEIIKDKAESDARILNNRAKTEAEAILTQYQKEAEAYKQIIEASGLGFTVEGFISYLGVRVIADAKNPVYIGLQSPAKSAYP